MLSIGPANTASLVSLAVTGKADSASSDAVAAPTDPMLERFGSAFTAEELDALTRVFDGLTAQFGEGGASAERRDALFGGILQNLVQMRAGGQDAVLVVFDEPGDGGFSATVMSQRDFALALASDDPGSLGTVEVNGQTTSYRDLARYAVGFGEEGKAMAGEFGASKASAGSQVLSPRDRIAAAVVEMLKVAAGEEESDSRLVVPAVDRDDADTDPVVAITRSDESGRRVQLLAFPSGASAGSDGRLLSLRV